MSHRSFIICFVVSVAMIHIKKCTVDGVYFGKERQKIQSGTDQMVSCERREGEGIPECDRGTIRLAEGVTLRAWVSHTKDLHLDHFLLKTILKIQCIYDNTSLFVLYLHTSAVTGHITMNEVLVEINT